MASDTGKLTAYDNIEQLPETLAVFPLTGAPLFPRWQLPLNVFEPRYLNMIDDAMSAERLIGIIQPMGGERADPALANVGCVGRITSYDETEDGRYTIVLTGIARFRVTREVETMTPYRKVAANYLEYSGDLQDPSLKGMPPRLRLEAALQIYTDARGFEADWQAVEDAPFETLVHALAAGCPFTPIEKQALIEAEDLKTRCETLITLLSMSAKSGSGETGNGPIQ